MITPVIPRWQPLVALLLLAALAQTAPVQAATTPAASPVSAPYVHFFRPHLGGPHTDIITGPLLYHGGPVVHGLTAFLIFWLPSGTCFEPIGGSCTSNNDGRYESLLVRFAGDVAPTPYVGLFNQYTDGAGGVTNNVSLGGTVVDTTPYPHAGTTADPLQDGDVRDEVTRVINAHGWPSGLNAEYFVYTGFGVQSCDGATGCSNTNYCAYHGTFPLNWIGGPTVLYANMPAAQSLSNCQGPAVSPSGDPSADDVIDISSHELVETLTDPELNAWFDAGGHEIGDKCAWTFGTALNANGTNVLLNHGDEYMVQQEWSNSANTCVLPGVDAITQEYITLGASSGLLGQPTSGETVQPCGGLMQTFANGRIYWSSASGAHEVHGTILSHYLGLGAQCGFLGYPTSDESPAPNGGRTNSFMGGAIYWTPSTGAYEVHGMILSHYLSLGGPGGFLGYPTSDESNTTTSGGRYNSFQGGNIYWSPASGAYEIHGALLTQYVSMGGPASCLGFPISDVTAQVSGYTWYYTSQEQHGSMTYSPLTGRVSTTCS